jgi:hypothetical protein
VANSRTFKQCSVSGCTSPYYGKSYCNKHYLRWKRHGDPLATTRAPIGSGCIHVCGYRVICFGYRRYYEHVMIAERALGHKLPKGAEVHHVNGIKSDNAPSNLVICPNRTYHMLLHIRAAAIDACGNPEWRSCLYCGKHDAIENLRPHGILWYHKPCAAAYQRARKETSTKISSKGRRKAIATPSVRMEIKALRQSGVSGKDVASKYGLSESYVSQIYTGALDDE